MIRHFTKQSTAVYVIYEPNYPTNFNLAANDFRSKTIFFQEHLTLLANRVSFY